MKVRVKQYLANREDLTHSELLKHFSYNPETGEFIKILEYNSWLTPKRCHKPVRGSNNRGYYWLRFRNLNFLVHRLIILYMTGSHPIGEVDHIDGDRKNNKFDNLRDVNPFENSRNQGNRIDNTSGCRGVSLNKNSNKWVARISHKGVRYSLGYFNDKNEAISVRKQAEKDFKFHPNHALRESWRSNENKT